MRVPQLLFPARDVARIPSSHRSVHKYPGCLDWISDMMLLRNFFFKEPRANYDANILTDRRERYYEDR
jgi:hypothetical protein